MYFVYDSWICVMICDGIYRQCCVVFCDEIYFPQHTRAWNNRQKSLSFSFCNLRVRRLWHLLFLFRTMWTNMYVDAVNWTVLFIQYSNMKLTMILPIDGWFIYKEKTVIYTNVHNTHPSLALRRTSSNNTFDPSLTVGL